MRKNRAKVALMLFALAGCSSCSSQLQEVDLSKEPAGASPGEAHAPAAPGMIPADCESLLNKSQVWGYFPGQKWKAASREQILEVAAFFGDFRLVPMATSDAFLRWDNGGSAPGKDVQLCDPFLAQTFLQAVIEYPWSRQDRPEAGKQLHRFLLNQQALSMPPGPRALSVHIYSGAVSRGLIPGSKTKAKELAAWVEKEIASLAEAQAEKGEDVFDRRELVLSGKIRNRLGALLPLP
jgi:hypothetical protein